MADLTDDRKYVARGWDESEQEANKTAAWIKLDPGQAVELVPVGEPEVFEKEFTNDGVAKVTKRWSIDVWVPKEKVLKTWEMSKSTFGNLKRQRQIRGDKFSNSVLRVERQGSGMQTVYPVDFIRFLEGNELDEKNAALLKAGTSPEQIPF